MQRPEFTQEQKDWMYHCITEWFLEWKNKLVDYDTCTNELWFAKEILAMRLCGNIREMISLLAKEK